MNFGKLNPQRGLTSSSPTKLLLHCDGPNGSTMVSDATGKAVTVVGNAQISTAQSKFGGSSLLFDGSGDYLTVSDSADWYFSADFTIDFWVYFNALPTTGNSMSFCSQGANPYWNFSLNNPSGSYVLSFYDANGGANETLVRASAGSLSTGNWYHIALVKNGSAMTYYINGVAKTNDINNSVYALTDYSSTFQIGSLNGNGTLNAYIDEFRVTKGTAIWTSNFTPPTSALTYDQGGRINFPGFQEILDYTVGTVDTYTKALFHFNGTDGSTTIIEETGRTVTSTAVTCSATKSKFGGTAGYFNGSTSKMSVPDSADWSLGTGAFTIDAWINLGSVAGSNILCTQFPGAVSPSWAVQTMSTGKLAIYMYNGGYIFNITCDYTFATNTWYHVAVVRIDGGNAATSWRMYVNGVSQTLTLVNGAWSGSLADVSAALEIGSQNGANAFNGYIDEFRFSKGIARWTSDFTPPTSEYLDVASSVMVAVDGDADKEYKILIRNFGTQTILLRINGDSGNNYGRQYIANASGTITAGRQVLDGIYLSGGVSVDECSLLTPTGPLKTAFRPRAIYSSGTTISDYQLTGTSWNNTANPTTLAFVSSSGNYTPGTRISVFARRSQ